MGLNRDAVADSQGMAGRKRQDILAEEDLMALLAVAGQRPERLCSFVRRLLVYGRHHTAARRFHAPKRVEAYAEMIPGVFFKRSAAAEYQVGPETVDRHGLA